jgi:hypothetical protein
VIAGFARATDLAAGRRELRAALSHVDAELGSMRVRYVRARHIAALLDDLESAGISPRREAAVVEALDALFAFARDRGLVASDPLARMVRHGPGPPAQAPGAGPQGPAAAAGPATATATMLALGARVATWTAVTVVVVFGLLLITLIAELA